MPKSVTLDELLISLQAGGRVLLPNPRAARELRSAYDDLQGEKGLAAWQPAGATAWSQWTNSLYNELVLSGAETRLLMNGAQEHSVWREIIDADPPAGSLDSSDSLAELAASGLRLAGAWNAASLLRSATSAQHGNADIRIFAQWLEEFRRRCVTDKLLPAALLEDALAKHVASKTLTIPRELRLVGFASFTPAQRTLLTAIRIAGTEIVEEELALSSATGLRGVVCLDGPVEELQFAARWLRKSLETAQEQGHTTRIAVLVPGLGEERADLEGVLRSTLAPELQAVGEDLSSTPWELSAGVPLSSLGMITDALDIARWVRQPLSLTRITALLLSPYLASGDEREEAARLDALFRSKENPLRPELTLSGFVALLDRHGSTLAWPRNLATELVRSGDITRARSHADWMELVRLLVQSTGWPNSSVRELTALEFAATRAWDGVLDMMATLDFRGRRITFYEALQALEMQTTATQFLPPSTGACVQVMTPHEAEGSVFDAVLFLHATDGNWPAAERPHPLLPWQLQKDLAMPGTDPVKAAERALAFTQGLIASAGTALFVYAKDDVNGKLRPSPLIEELGVERLDAATLLSAEVDEARVPYEIVADDSPLPPLPSNEIRGGSRVLQLQAACGFQAFAEFRLNAKRMEDSDLGFDAPESGRHLHEALQHFWKHVKTQDALRAMPAEERDFLLGECIDRSLAEHVRPESAWDHAFVALQKQRMFSLLQQWMATELQRGPFTVLDSEQDQRIGVGPLSLEVRLDRIDSVPTGDGDGFVLVDYKTGNSGSPHQWIDDRGRPDDPQLPLYSLLDSDGQLKGLAFGKVVAGGMKWLGYQAEEGILPKSSSNPVVDMPAAVTQWRETLERLAYSFAAGKAAVDPKEYPNTCKRCSQRLLCRVDPAALSTPLLTGELTEEFDE